MLKKPLIIKEGFFFYLFNCMKKKVIHIFDMDDTLIETPLFVDFVSFENGQIIANNENVEKHIQKLQGAFLTLFAKELCFERSGDSILAINCKTKKPFGAEQLDYLHDLTPEQIQGAGFKKSLKKDLLRAFTEESGLLILKPYPGFYDAVETLGFKINTEIFFYLQTSGE